MKYYGIRGLAHDWFASYLTDRNQYVVFDGAKSSCQEINCGVPQGSNLGPLLFLLYVNDMPMCCTLLKPILYADDTTLIASGQDLKILAGTVSSELLTLQDWYRANKLKVHPDKTFYICYSLKQKERFLPDVSLSLENVVLRKVPSIVFLGLETDKNMLWKDQVNRVCNKISKANYIINRTKNNLRLRDSLAIYNTLVNSLLNYGILAWGGLIKVYPSFYRRLITLQKKCICSACQV